MLLQESERIELKRQYVDDINKTIVAFANTLGGKIYIGVEDNGEVIGVNSTDEVLLSLSNIIKGTISPDITLFIKTSIISMENKAVIKIDVERGTSRPYYLSKKGLRPIGVYTRIGSASMPASDNAILKMIKESSGDDYESAVSINQSLTFSSCNKVFDDNDIKLSKNKMRSLGIINENGLYTNLALLLSEQCPFTIKIAAFEGNTKKEFVDRSEITGSLFDQLDKASSYIKLSNKTGGKIKGLYRYDNIDYPPSSIREALLNALVHRDYSISGSTLISIFDDKIEFVSLGGLVEDLDYDDIFIGTSKTRNPQLANIFYRLNLVEAFGTGIPRIFEEYKNSTEPKIITSSNAFKIILYNKNAEEENPSIMALKEGHYEDDDQDKILLYLATNDYITRSEAEKLIKASTSTTLRVLDTLVKSHQVWKINSGKRTKYVLNRSNNF